MVFLNCFADSLPECISGYSENCNLILQSVYLPNRGLTHSPLMKGSFIFPPLDLRQVRVPSLSIVIKNTVF